MEHHVKMNHHSYVTKTVEYADLFDDKVKEPEAYLGGINKRWLIEGFVHMISVDRFDSFSMSAEHGLLVMFQDYLERSEVKRLFSRLNNERNKFKGVWLTLVNHQALFRLLRKVLMLPNEIAGRGESFEAYEGLLKAILSENSLEMKREREILQKIDGEPDIRDAKIIMQQDLLNLDQFGENKKELEKVQILKYLVLCEYGKENKQVGDAINRVVSRHGFESEFSYMLLAQMPLGVYHDKNNSNEGLYYLKRSDYEKSGSLRLWDEFVSYISDKSIDVWDTEKMKNIFTEEEILDNTCFRKYPVLKMSDVEYLIASQPYYSHLLYDGFWWDVKSELKTVLSNKAIMNLLTKDFSEMKLFYNLVKQLVGNRRIRIYNEHCFDKQQPSPDIALRTRHRLYLFEYKDMRVQKEVADGNDMAVVMNYIDDRLNKEKGKDGGNKGLPQLISDMEDFFLGKQPWVNDCRKRNIKIHPVLVVNSRLFGVRGINYILQQKMRQRILESEVLKEHSKEIGNLLVMDYDMLILVVVQTNKDFGRFQNLLFSYLTHVGKAHEMVDRCDSFRHYVMNKWEGKMTKKSERQLMHNFKRVVKEMTKEPYGRTLQPTRRKSFKSASA